MNQNLEISNIKYIDDLENFLQAHNLSKEEVVIRGSGPIVLRGLREQGDIDILTSKKLSNESLKNAPVEIGIKDDYPRYREIGLSVEEIINNPKYYDVVDGWKFLRPEITLSIKRIKNRRKDHMDCVLLEEYAYQNQDDWDWNLVQGDGYSTPEKSTTSLVYEFKDYIEEDGISKALDKFHEFIYYRLRDVYKKYPIKQIPARYKMGKGLKNNYLTYIGIDEILAKQFVDGKFIRKDLIIKLLLVNSEISGKDIDLSDYDGFKKLESETNIYKEWANTSPHEPVKINYQHEIVHEGGLISSIINGGYYVPIEFVGKKPSKIDLGTLSQNESKLIGNVLSNLKWTYGLYFYVIVWPGAIDDFDIIHDLLNDKYDIIESTKIKHNDLYQFAKKVYISHRKPSNIAVKKADELIETNVSGPNMGIFVIDFEDRNKNTDNYKQLNDVKENLRETFENSFGYNKRQHVIHTTDTYYENREMNQLLSEYLSHQKNTFEGVTI